MIRRSLASARGRPTRGAPPPTSHPARIAPPRLTDPSASPPTVDPPRPKGIIALVRFDEVFGLWQEGERRLTRAEPADRQALERVVDEVVLELHRRLGGPFTTEELAQLYAAQGTDWCFEIATRVAPDNPAAWDMPTVAGAAFARYAREAIDYRLRQTAGER